MDYGVGGDAARRAGTILDHERLAEPVGKALREQPRENVADAAGAVADQQADRPRRIIGRQRRPRQRGNAQAHPLPGAEIDGVEASS